MRNIARLIITAAICTVILSAADVKVIANSSVGVSSITAEELKNVFLMTTRPRLRVAVGFSR